MDKLKIPETFHQLDYARPAFLLQKVLCRNMIMWDEIQPSQQWVDSQIPEMVKFSFENSISSVEKKFS